LHVDDRPTGKRRKARAGSYARSSKKMGGVWGVFRNTVLKKTSSKHPLAAGSGRSMMWEGAQVRKDPKPHKKKKENQSSWGKRKTVQAHAVL